MLLFTRATSRPSTRTLSTSAYTTSTSLLCRHHTARWTPICSRSRSYHKVQRPIEPVVAASGLTALAHRNKALEKKGVGRSARTESMILGQDRRLPIRARFAPSPTGYLHVGSLRTALFSYLAAKASKGGAFILRLEDTDQKRLVHDSEDRLIQDLKWAGLQWDEGPDCGGPYGPYKQSLRLDIYESHVQTLLDRGHAYRCFCTSEQLENQKRELHEAGKSTAYPGTCRTVDTAEADMRASRGDAHVVRLKGDTFGRPKFCDAVYGAFQKAHAEEDFVLLKSDGFPTYHLACVVDDHLMKITHVIRGEEWLISTPKHLALYQAFGWEPPTFAHVGLLSNPDGTKLSKRDDSVDISTYRNKYFFPVALLNWVGNLGSSFKSVSYPLLRISDLVNAFTFHFTRGAIKLNAKKLDHIQDQYRNALLKATDPQIHENGLKECMIREYITKPVLQELRLVTNGQSDKMQLLPESWRDELILVPALSDLESSSAQEYIFGIAGTARGGYMTVDSLLQRHPYLAWQVPENMYTQSLTSYTPDQRVIQALEGALEKRELWEYDGQGKLHITDAIRTTLENESIDKLQVYNTLRLIGAGRHDVASQDSEKMFMSLGRDEWQRRTDTVKKLLRGGNDA
ncbi:hypothetical protein E4U56_008476 [Claviceps arundinis]|uniref:Glutamate--tRNA ligase, mitochondrial n=1 Tax=Claviceps arundinis TaxID=1623583 RepID=A0A9P7SPG1_9HYPO|nr:hypothetical protein E4U56_008476 [Claviceps arundinis]